jgi:cohesin loading factor subunit SCC2
VKRRRKGEAGPASPPPDLDNYVPRKVSRKIERKLVPRLQKIDPETLMESNTFQRFNKTMETVFDNAEEVSSEFF